MNIRHVVEVRRPGFLAVIYVDEHRVHKRQFSSPEQAEAWVQQMMQELKQEMRV